MFHGLDALHRGLVDTSTAGVYTITYNAREDATGRVVSTSRTVIPDSRIKQRLYILKRRCCNLNRSR